MKKILLTSVLGGILLTGCIDNSAIQKLNDSAEKYLNESQPAKAVCRLEASKELNPNIYETRYNLGVAYIETKEYLHAIEEINDAIKIKDDNPNAYFTLGVAYDSLGFEILNKNKNVDNALENGVQEEQPLTDEEISTGIEALTNAVDAYKTYLEKNPNAEDRESVEGQIESINNKISEYQKGDE